MEEEQTQGKMVQLRRGGNCENRTRKENEEQESRGEGVTHKQMPTLLRCFSGADGK